jgi:hypothetical protein
MASLAIGAGAVAAQEAGPANRQAVGLGVGGGSAAMSVGDRRTTTGGVSISGRIGIDSRNRLLVMAEFNTAEVANPVMDESFRAVNILLGYGIGKAFRVRPAIGIQVRSWSGDERVTDSDATLVVGLDAGPEFRVSPRFSISPEVVLRYSLIEFEGSVGSRFIGLQVVGSWRLSKD